MSFTSPSALATMSICAGVHSAFALTLPSQFASHFASTLQPPSSLPPEQEMGVKSASHLPSHLTEAVAEPWHFASQLPLHEPLHFTPGAVTEQVPSHVPSQVPSALMPVPVPPCAEPLQVPSHLPVHCTPP